MILAGVMLLQHVGEGEAAQRIERAVRATIAEGEFVTPDIRKDSGYGTGDFSDAVIRKLKAG